MSGRRSADAVMFMNGLSVAVSGGDVHALRLLRAWNATEGGPMVLIAPDGIGPRLDPEERALFRPVRTSFDRLAAHPVPYSIAVVLRMARASAAAPRARVAVAATHFLFDVVPAAIHRATHSACVVSYVYHLVGESRRARSVRSIVSTLAERLSVWLLRRVAALVFVDNVETASELSRRGLPAGRIVLTRNAYDPELPLPPRGQHAGPMAVFCGRLVPEKGVWDVLDVAEALRRSLPEARVTVLGDGPLRASLEDAARSRRLGNVDVKGFVEEAEKWRLLRSADLLVAPSREEGWGIAVGEALYAGTPALVYDLPAYSHFGDRVDRVTVGDSTAFVRRTVELLADPAAREHLRSRIDRAPLVESWDDIVGHEIQLIRSRCALA